MWTNLWVQGSFGAKEKQKICQRIKKRLVQKKKCHLPLMPLNSIMIETCYFNYRTTSFSKRRQRRRGKHPFVGQSRRSAHVSTLVILQGCQDVNCAPPSLLFLSNCGIGVFWHLKMFCNYGSTGAGIHWGVVMPELTPTNETQITAWFMWWRT